MLDIYNRFRDFHVFKRFKYLIGDWWNIDIFIVVRDRKKFFYDSTHQLNNFLVKNLLESPVFKNYFLKSIHLAMNNKVQSHKDSKYIPWKQTGLDLFIVPFSSNKNTSLKACLVAAGFSPKKRGPLCQSLSYLGLSKKAIDQKIESLKSLSPEDEIHVQKMLKILVEDFFVLFQEKQNHVIQKLNYKSPSHPLSVMVGKSPSMRYIFTSLEKLKKHDTHLLIEGEKGTGKKLLSRIIHQQSFRAKKPFSLQDFSDLKGNFAEIELFGYNSNSPVKTNKKKKTLWETLKGGTLLLHEVGNSNLSFQNQLLKSVKKRQTSHDVRIIATSSKNLGNLVKKGTFKADLYSLIKEGTIKTSPLKNKKEDIPLLIDHFLNRTSGSKNRHFSLKAIKTLSDYSWPGNIQELENEITKILSTVPDKQKILTEKDISPHIRERSFALIKTLFQPEKKNLKSILRSIEKQILLDHLKKYNWNKTKVAKILGASRTSIVMKTKEYGIKQKKGA